MSNYIIESVSVDKDILDYLKVICFGSITDPFEAAAFRAYRDFNRTLRFGDMLPDDRLVLRKNAVNVLRKQINGINACSSQKEFDTWHRETCDQILNVYTDKIEFTYGQAQKWLNMTIKYLYVIGACQFDNVFKFCHIPIDKYVFQIAKKEYGVSIPKVKWSRWNDYDGQYLDYQNQLRDCIKGYDPLRWEFKYWIKEARQVSEDKG